MSGILKLICTPIGNLGDMTPRALAALSSCSLILAEDTRHSMRLVQGLGVVLDAKFVSCPQQRELSRVDLVIERLQAGEHVAFMSDAGAPGISDPGGRLVDAVVKAGFAVEVLPGPSAVIAALMGAGVISHRYAFLGFLPRKGGERERLVRTACELELAVVLFESPFRVRKMLEHLHKWCGPRRVVVARELTKKFETFHRGILGEELVPTLIEKGEFVIVVEGGALK